MTMLGHNSRVTQSIFRSNPDSNYTKISNVLLQDKRLSHEARGLLAELLSRPEDWEITVASIVKSGPSGRDKVYRMLKEAEKFGYGLAQQERRLDGAFQKQQYLVTDEPRLLIDITARELLALESGALPFPENTEAVVLPFPEKPEAVNAKNGLNQAASWKAVSGQPLPENPFTAEPFTAKPTHTKERYIQTTEITKTARRENEDVGCQIKRTAAAVAMGIAVAATPMAVAAQPDPVAIVQTQAAAPSMRDVSDRLFAAAGNAMRRGNAGLEVMSTPRSWIENGCDLEMDILPVVSEIASRKPAQSISTWSFFTQAIADAKARRTAPLPPGDGRERSAGQPQTAQDYSAKYKHLYDGVL